MIVLVGMIGEWSAQFCLSDDKFVANAFCWDSDSYAENLCDMQRLGFWAPNSAVPIRWTMSHWDLPSVFWIVAVTCPRVRRIWILFCPKFFVFQRIQADCPFNGHWFRISIDVGSVPGRECITILEKPIFIYHLWGTLHLRMQIVSSTFNHLQWRS